MNKLFIIGTGAVMLAALAFVWFSTAPPDQATANPATPIVNTAMHGAGAAAPAQAADSIIVPSFSQAALSGEQFFNQFCSACHGKNAAGTNQGPPLLHQLYVPGHHGDASIRSAALNGVTAHHWRFGNMPPVEGIQEEHIGWITKYLRELQAANGIR